MAGILKGKHAGFLSEEIFSEDMNIEAVDGDLLAEELEQAQEQLFAEQEKFNIAIEAECETEETKQEIMEALESDINDVVYAKLLVNKLSKNNTLFYGDSKPLTSGLESDRNSNAKTILTAGLEDAKGMLGSIKEFIAKVWQKIKDAFAWVWKKMKDFWAWLTGASKKAEEKKEETVVAAAGVNAATTKSKEIIAIAQTSSYKAGGGSEVNSKRAAEAVKKYKERMDKAASSNKTKGESGLTVKGGKFDGRDLGSLSFSEMSEMLEEGNVANTETVNDVVIADVIIEEVAKTTGLSEEKVASYISPAMMKIMKVFAFDPSLLKTIVETINENYKINSNLISYNIEKIAIFNAAQDVNAFVNSCSLSPVDMEKSIEDWKFEDVSVNNVMRKWSSSILSYVGEDFIVKYIKENKDYISPYTNIASKSARSLEQAVDIVGKYLEDKDSRREENQVKQIPFILPIKVSRGTSIEEVSSITYINFTGSTTIDINNNSQYQYFKSDIESARKKITGFKFNDNILKDLMGLDIGSKVYKNVFSVGISELEKDLDSLAKTIDKYLLNLKDVDASKKDKDWNKAKLNLLKLVSNSSFYNPRFILEAVKMQVDVGYSIYDTILDIPGAIAQASKEFDSSKFKFDKK